MGTSLQSLTNKLAVTLGMGDDNGHELIDTLKATAFRGQVSDAQMTALMVVANQYRLNPWTREIYAFPDRNNGIVPIVGVDGWSRIINDHPQFDGMEFDSDESQCTCRIFRKDRSHPVSVTEYMGECARDTAPWKSHKRRMLRHKAMIQCARLAFGYGGIFDQDEAETFVQEKELHGNVIDGDTGEILKKEAPKKPDKPALSDGYIIQKKARWQESIDAGKPASELLAMLESRYTLSTEQRVEILAMKPTPAPAPEPEPAQEPIDDEFVRQMEKEALPF